MNPETTAVVLTAVGVETSAVLARLDNIRPDQVGETALHLGHYRAFTIAVVEVGAGNPGAASVATVALSHYKPGTAAFVGIAGGVKDVAIGDVVVATKVYGYESGKEYPGGFRTRPDVRSSSQALVSRARVIRRDPAWQNGLTPALWPNGRPEVFVAPIAAGEVVVGTDRGRIAALIQQTYGDAVAIEMEGRGFLEAIYISSGCHGVVVRGISDLLSGKAEAEAQGSQKRAADAAAAFFFAMLDFKAGSPDPGADGITPEEPNYEQSPRRKTTDRPRLLPATLASPTGTAATTQVRRRNGQVAGDNPEPTGLSQAKPLRSDTPSRCALPPTKDTNPTFLQPGPTASVPPPGSDKKKRHRPETQDRRLRKEKERRLQELKDSVVKILEPSTVAMDALDATAPRAKKKPSPTALTRGQRAVQLVDDLVNIKPFERGKDWLLASHKRLADTRRNDGVDVIIKVSQHIIPWVWVASCGHTFDTLEEDVITDVIALPAGTISFAEIIMAGIDARAVDYEPPSRKGSPLKPKLAAELTPESGPDDEGRQIEKNLRSDLINRVGLPPESQGSNDASLDDGINSQLALFLDDYNTRIYWNLDGALRTVGASHIASLKERVNKRYPLLAIIQLDQPLWNRHLESFNQIRKLLHPGLE
jgi:nucleoside phosphorylase